MRIDKSPEDPAVILNSITVMKVVEASASCVVLMKNKHWILYCTGGCWKACVAFQDFTAVIWNQCERNKNNIKLICKWGGSVATFPGKGSDDAVEQTDGTMQTGCCLLRCPVNLAENHIFPLHFCESRTRAHAFSLESKQCQWHTEPHLNLHSSHFIFCF